MQLGKTKQEPTAHQKVFRPVCQNVNRALGSQLPQGPFDFGLYFKKWFFLSAGWKCQAGTGRDLEDNLASSLNLFNQSNRWDRSQAVAALKAKHQKLEAATSALMKLGYELHSREFNLETPLILGLGDEHPTEKGFRFDWTQGIPFIPASSLKGVVRLAWLVSHLNSLSSLKEAEDFCQKLTNDKLEEAKRLPEGALALFGCGGDQSRRGRVIFLDAYPTELPRLKAEIMTSHYRDYYEGKRGPTEDQQPNPQKFWAVDPFLDEARKQPLTFVFRLLVAPEIALDTAQKERLLQAFEAALRKHGLGAKTAIGHGRFLEVKTSPTRLEEEESKELKRPPTAEVWERANLSWDPGSVTLTATRGKDKAYLRGKAAVNQVLPADLFKKIVEKRKTAEARVTVQDFQIIKVEPF
uniref:Type III-B CRISPR module RAMP protein Cmr6 n=1 Tax=Desulfobacca acetoxidans TaxID=60893 RepID=A0A7C5AMQ9_9BACT